MSSTSVFRKGLSQTYQTVSVASQTALTLTIAQMLNRCLEFTGALAADCTVTFPGLDAGLEWELLDSSTGGHNLIVSGPSGATYTLPKGRPTRVLWNGAAMVPSEQAAVRSDVAIVTGITGASPTVTLTAAQSAQGIISLQGNATGTPVIVVPSSVAQYIVNTQLASATNVQVKTATGTAATLNKQGNALIFVDSSLNTQIVASTSS